MVKQASVAQSVRETIRAVKNSSLAHLTIRAVADHEMPSGLRNASSTAQPGRDFSQAIVRPGAAMVGRDYGVASCPASPRTCRFGGACHTCPAWVQAKLTINQPGDKYEQEADRVAEQVMRMPQLCSQCQDQSEEEETLQPKPLSAHTSPLVQRQVKPKEEEEKEAIQAKLTSDTQVQRQVEEPAEYEAEKAIPTKRNDEQIPQVKLGLETRVRALCGDGQPLQESVQSFFESRFGYDFSQVRVHTDTKSVQSARMLNAHAYTIGRDIVFALGQYNPETLNGRRLLAHELTHVVQQNMTHTDAPRSTLPRITPTTLGLQTGPPVTEAGRHAQTQARGDIEYLRTTVVAALRATGDPIRVNTADTIRDGILSLGVITRHPEPARHASGVMPSGTYFFPDTDMNQVIEAPIDVAGAAHVPGAPSNRIFLLVRYHPSDPRPSPSAFFRKIVHEAQHYLDRHTDEVRARRINPGIFDLWLNYKSEFNAYWADGRFDHYPVTAVGLSSSGPRIVRWQAIRYHLMNTRPYSATFRWLWLPTPPPRPSGQGESRRISQWRSQMYSLYHNWFQQQVDSYHEPEVLNRRNSPRIERFYQVLQRTPLQASLVRQALSGLDEADIAEIQASARFQRLVTTRLRQSPRLLADVRSRIWPPQSTATPAAP